jgi:hypothetical protein
MFGAHALHFLFGAFGFCKFSSATEARAHTHTHTTAETNNKTIDMKKKEASTGNTKSISQEHILATQQMKWKWKKEMKV